jgi:hypothetical protein
MGGSGGSSGLDGGTPPDLALPPGGCFDDGPCGAGNWCQGTPNQCNGFPNHYVIGAGTCHRDCSHGGCTCFDASDCPGGYCDGSPLHCISPGPPPSYPPCGPAPTCLPGCTVQQTRDHWCPVCICAACPTPVQAKTGLHCGNQTCAANEFCVDSTVSNGAQCTAQDLCLSNPTCDCFTNSGILQCSGNPQCSVDNGGIVHCPI